jgi:hypothetical protein
MKEQARMIVMTRLMTVMMAAHLMKETVTVTVTRKAMSFLTLYMMALSTAVANAGLK